MKPKVVLTHWVHPRIIKLLSTSTGVIPNTTRKTLPRSEVIVWVKDTDVLMAFMSDSIGSALLGGYPKLRVIGATPRGYDNFNVNAYARHGVWLAIVSNLLTIPITELTIGLLLGLAGYMLEGDRQIRSGHFQDWRPTLYGSSLTGRAPNIIGMGAVGRTIAQRLAGSEMNLLYCDPILLNAEREKTWHIQHVTLDELLEKCDCVVPMIPMAAETLHLIDATALAKMETGSYLISACRGSVVDENAVIAVPASGRLTRYTADVFGMEEWIRADCPRAIPKALLDNTTQAFFTPHLGSVVKEVRLEIERQAVMNTIRALADKKPMGAISQPYLGVKAA